MLYDQAGRNRSGKSKMAAIKLKVLRPICQLVDNKKRDLNGSTKVFGVMQSNGKTKNNFPSNRKCKIKDGGLESLITYISACTQDSKKFPTAIPLLSGSNYQIRLVVMLYDQTGRNQKWKIQDGGHLTGISACRQDRNAISMAKPMFSGSINPTKLLRIISHQTGRDKSTENTFPPNW